MKKNEKIIVRIYTTENEGNKNMEIDGNIVASAQNSIKQKSKRKKIA